MENINFNLFVKIGVYTIIIHMIWQPFVFDIRFLWELL